MRRGPYRRRSKFHAVPTTIDGIRFMSKAEGRAYRQIQAGVRAGVYRSVTLQPKFPMVVNGVPVCTYIADFEVVLPNGEVEVIDVKGVRTAVYRLKMRLFRILYGFKVTEWKA